MSLSGGKGKRQVGIGANGLRRGPEGEDKPPRRRTLSRSARRAARLDVDAFQGIATSPILLGGPCRGRSAPCNDATTERAAKTPLARPRVCTACASARTERRAPIREPLCSSAQLAPLAPMRDGAPGQPSHRPPRGMRRSHLQDLVARGPLVSVAMESVRPSGGPLVPVGHVEAHDRRSKAPKVGGGRGSVDHDHGERTRRGHK
jgi:hypothetical protein